MPQFDVQFFASQIFWVCICFGILWGAMHFWVVPSVQHIWAERSGYVREISEEAERLNGVSSDIRARCEAQREDLEHHLHQRLQTVSQTHEEILARRMQDLEKEFNVYMHETKEALFALQETFSRMMTQETLETAQHLLDQYQQGKTYGRA